MGLSRPNATDRERGGERQGRDHVRREWDSRWFRRSKGSRRAPILSWWRDRGGSLTRARAYWSDAAGEAPLVRVVRGENRQWHRQGCCGGVCRGVRDGGGQSELFLTWSDPLFPLASVPSWFAYRVVARSGAVIGDGRVRTQTCRIHPPRFTLACVVMMVLTSRHDGASVPSGICCPCAMPSCQVQAGGGSGGGGGSRSSEVASSAPSPARALCTSAPSLVAGTGTRRRGRAQAQQGREGAYHPHHVWPRRRHRSGSRVTACAPSGLIARCRTRKVDTAAHAAEGMAAAILDPEQVAFVRRESL
jgi:hypothetical protein